MESLPVFISMGALLVSALALGVSYKAYRRGGRAQVLRTRTEILERLNSTLVLLAKLPHHTGNDAAALSQDDPQWYRDAISLEEAVRVAARAASGASGHASLERLEGDLQWAIEAHTKATLYSEKALELQRAVHSICLGIQRMTDPIQRER